MSDHKRISIVIPAYNEERNLPALFDALKKTFTTLDADAEFIFIDDGSTDTSLAVMEKLASQDPRVRVIGLSRNFGKEIATTAGVHACTGDACIMIDADLQHPVELIPEFIRRWRGGAEVVVGVRESDADATSFRRLSSSAFYALMNAIAETPITPNATDFRLLDRAVIDEFNRFTERRRMTRALIDWLGFRREYVPFSANRRNEGVTRYGTLCRLRLAMSSIVSHSLFPLKLAGYLGVLITLVAGALGLFILVEKYFLRDPLHMGFSGSAILAVINLFLVGIMLSCLGLIALYIANIHGEVINRPLYAVRVRRNLK
jgi:glycosyltransferase involved in cell wall biosynthesis